MPKKTLLTLLCILLLQVPLFSQKHTISGYVKDQSNGEVLIGARVSTDDLAFGTASNAYGFYSLTLNEGKYSIVFSYMGFTTSEVPVGLTEDKVLNMELQPEVTEMNEVVVSAKKDNDAVVSTTMSNVSLSAKTISRIPVVMGETDLIKSLQLLPGIKSTGGLGSGMSIRGSARDQNLILLDEATVYNAAHLGGIFSVFNNDAIKSVELYKGFIPAEYGGRLASVLDIRMKDGNAKRISGNGGIGLVSSRLTIEGPIIKDKCSFFLSGRRTYVDAVVNGYRKLSDNEKIGEFPVYFYDVNSKINYSINQNNRIFLSGYFGRDYYSYSMDESSSSKFDWGNYTATVRWNHVFNSKLFSNYTLLASKYDYLMDTKYVFGRDKKTFSYQYDAFIKDYSAKIDYGWYLNGNNTLKFGLNTTWHDINVGKINGRQDTVKFSFVLPSAPGVENAIYVRNEQKIGNFLALNYGFRYSAFFNPGNNKFNVVNDDYIVTGDTVYSWDESFYHGFEPRLGLTYIIDDKQSVKASWIRTKQYMLIASNSTTGNPLDVWILANPNIKPQKADQWGAGYFRNFLDNSIEFSAEVYYKKSDNQVTFREFAQPQFNQNMEEDLRFGKGRSYGVEFLLKKNDGRFSGWISYDYSRSELKINDIQEKSWFLSPYDSPHNINIVLIYNLTKRIDISADWIWRSGQPFCAPSMRYEYGNLILPYYKGRNSDRLPNFHRLDMSVTFKKILSRNKKWNDELVLSVYNVYNYKTPDIIYFDQDETDYYTTHAKRVTYIPFFPSLTYNFNF